MKSLHLQGAVEKSDSSQTLQKYRVEKSQRTRVTKNDKHSSFTSRVDDSHGSNSFYDHPTKSHSQNYKNYKKNQTSNANVPWMISSSSPLSLSKSDPKYASYMLIVSITKMLICVIMDVSYQQQYVTRSNYYQLIKNAISKFQLKSFLKSGLY